MIDVTWSRDEQLQTAETNDETPDDTVAFLTVQYRALLDEGEPRLAGAFRILAAEEALPAVFLRRREGPHRDPGRAAAVVTRRAGRGGR